MIYYGRKTSPPFLPSPILFREALIHTLEEALIISPLQTSTSYKLVLLRAPAGYGKTTLIGDFMRRYNVPVGWYFLDRMDTQLSVFLEILIAIFCQEFPDLKKTFHASFIQDLISALQSTKKEQFKQILHSFTDALEQYISHPFILCFCDYQEVNEYEAIQIILNHFLENMPSKLSFIIESRAVPFLELTSLLARRQLLGLGSDVLRFSSQEVHEFSHLQGFPIKGEEAERLVSTFDGWIAGMLLATSLGKMATSDAMELSHTPWNSPALFADQHTLLSYIKNDVFAKETREFHFLQETSLICNLSVPHCNRLLQIEHAEKFLTHIERQGLFITRVSGQGAYPTYRLHPTLRQLLYENLRSTQHERTICLHQRAVDLFLSLGDYEQAIAHALTSQEYTIVVDIIKKTALPKSEDLIQQQTLANWFELLPIFVREQNPHLLLIRANLHLKQYEYLQAASLLEKAYQLVMQQFLTFDEEVLLPLLAEIVIARSTILFNEGKYALVQQMCSEALGYLSVDETELRIPAFIRLGVCKTLLGNYVEGLSSLQHALQLSGHGSTTQQTAYIHSCLANNYSLICNYVLAEYHRNRAIALYECLNDTHGKINNLIWMAILKRNKGAFQEAETMLRDIISMAQEEGFQSGEAYALFNLGANYNDVQALPQALIALEESLRIACQMGDSRLNDQCLCELAMTHLLLEDSHTAQILITQMTVASTEQTGYETFGYELVRGTVLLYQQDFANAYTCLSLLEPLVQRAELKRSHIECLIRLAVCQYRLNRFDEMEVSMEKVVQIVQKGHFEHIPFIELRRFSEIWKTVQQFSSKACINTWRAILSRQGENKEVQGQNIFSAQQNLSFEHSSKVKLQIQALGEPLVTIDGASVTRWTMVRSMEMFFFLLEYQRPIRKEQLVEALWSEEEYIDQTIRSALHYLRKVIGGSCIISHRGTYALDLSILYRDDIWYDVSLFREHHLSAQEALHRECYKQAEEHLQAMVELYRGDYVQPFYGNWCIPHRDELRRLYMDAQRELAHITWNNNQFEKSVSHWQQILVIDSCSEEAHYGLMRCYNHIGKRSLAVRQYQRCNDILQSELAISPGPALQKLYQQLTNNC